jgi:hypothetical protein
MKVSTLYQKSIKSPSDYTLLKKGSSNAKLGYKVSSKKWNGSRLYSLTLVERETCPRTCHHWDDCYGNNMPFAHRFSTDGLMPKLRQEVETLLQKHKDGITIRLHVLGDFYSVDYVRFWESMLLGESKLTLFGYTAHPRNSEIGKAIWLMNIRFSERCVIRYSHNAESNMLGEWYAAEESFEGRSFDCPEQLDKVKDCASCGLCWTTQKTVRFASH